MTMERSVPSRVFRVFISSTFSDLIEERNALQQEVFPKLRLLCEEQRCRFQAVDLRWGVSEAAAQDHRVLDICCEEVLRCKSWTPRPNFVVLLGERYGWEPLPPAIPRTEFEDLLGTIDPDEARNLVRDWYRLDANQEPPSYRLVSLTEASAGFPAWEETESSLRIILQKAAEAANLPESKKAKYTASATEHEIQLGALDSSVTQDEVFCFFRTIEHPSPECPLLEDDSEKRGLLGRLKRTLSQRFPGQVREYTASWTNAGVAPEYLAQLCRDVYNSLSAVILREIGRLSSITDHEEQKASHNQFLEDRLRAASNGIRVKFRRQGADRIAGTVGAPIFIVGEAGSGKTTVMAQLAAEMSLRFPSGVVIAGFAGITPEFSTVTGALRHLCSTIDEAYGADSAAPRSAAEVLEAFPGRLATATATRPLFLFLDAADALEGEGQPASYSWLPSRLPPHANLVLTAGVVPTELTTDETLLKVPDLSYQEAGVLLDQWLREAGRNLQPEQRGSVLSSTAANGSPLYLRLAFEEARLWRSSDDPPTLPSGLDEMIDAFFRRLEHPAQHGLVLVQRALGLLCATRHGLAEDEAVSILSSEDVLKDLAKSNRKAPEVAQLPFVIWSRLLGDLDPFLLHSQSDGAIVLRLGNRRVLERAMALYFPRQRAAAVHEILAVYFRQRTDINGDASWAGNDRRGFRELAYHLYEGGRLSDNSAELDRLALDAQFRERQFLVLRQLESLVECVEFALRLAVAAEDPPRAIQFALERSALSFTIAGTFLHHLVVLADTDPETARAVADTIPRSSDRILALVWISWICWAKEELRALGRRILKDIAESERAPVEVFQVDFLIAMIRDLVENGAPEALELLDLVPDCPLRASCRLSWRELPGPPGAMAERFSRPAMWTASEDDYRNTCRIERFVARQLTTGEYNRKPAVVEERAVREFSARGASGYYFLFAGKQMAMGNYKDARLTVNRALYVASHEDRSPVRTHVALAKALYDAGDRDMARENRNRATTYLRTKLRFFHERESWKSLLPVLEDLIPLHNEIVAVDPEIVALNKKFATLSAEIEGDAPSLARVKLLRACRRWEANDPEGAARLVEEAFEAADQARSDATLWISLYSISSAVGSDRVCELAGSRLRLLGISPDPLFDQTSSTTQRAGVISQLASGDALDVESVAGALRIKGNISALFRLVLDASILGFPPTFIDAISAQVVRTGQAGQPEKIHHVITAHGSISPIAQGLGLYYWAGTWIFFLLVGGIAVALGGKPDRNALIVAGTFFASSVGGGLADLWIWSRIGLWKVPERSMRAGAEAGTLMAIWGAIWLSGGDLSALFTSNNVGYGFCSTLLATAGLAVGLGWVYYQYGLARFKKVSVAGLVCLGTAVVLSQLLPNLGRDWQTGIFLGGSLLVTIGLNLLTKHIPVRRFYGPNAGKRRSTVAPVDLPPDEFDDSPLHKQVVRADRRMLAGDLKGAVELYSGVIADSRFGELPAKTRSSIYNNRGLSSRRLGDPVLAMRDLEEASRLDPRSFSHYLNQGLICAQELRRSRRAEELLTGAISRNPFSPDAYSSRGLVRRDLASFRGAEEDLEMAVSLNPFYADGLWNLAQFRRQQGRFQDAARLFGQAADLEPEDPEHRTQQFASLLQGGYSAELGELMKNHPREASRFRARTGLTR
jgi:tetratricopeptide (TPR) repeat protein